MDYDDDGHDRGLLAQDIVEQLLAEPRVAAASIAQLLEHVQQAVAGGNLDDQDLNCLFQPDVAELLLGPTAIDLRLGVRLLSALRPVPALLEAAYSLVRFSLTNAALLSFCMCGGLKILPLRCCRSHA